jgi:transaldolase
MAPSPNLQRLHEAGVSIWLDTLSRRLLESGEFAELIGDYSVTGATSKPTIFAKAITDSDGLPAIEELTRRGVNINVTLLFSVERYEQVVEAYLRGLDARVQAGEALDSIALVASFFLSRIDAAVDAQLPEGSPLCGRVALASARVAYQR